ncbi:Phosphotyrosine-binding domain [Conglomerata obtusa]
MSVRRRMQPAIEAAKIAIKLKSELKKCVYCNGNVKLRSCMRRTRCTKRGCRKYMPIGIGIISKSKIEVADILELLFYIIIGDTSKHIRKLYDVTYKALYRLRRGCHIIIKRLLDIDNAMVGGPGIIVEIDESKFGRSKYHRGHAVEGVWIVGMVERWNGLLQSEFYYLRYKTVNEKHYMS